MWGAVIQKADVMAHKKLDEASKAVANLQKERKPAATPSAEEQEAAAKRDAASQDIESLKTVTLAHHSRTATYLRDALSATNSASGSSTTFGGYQTCSVYRLTPSDPCYRAVLTAPVICRPFSKTATCSVGSSTMVIVQESPSEFHVQSVDTDASVLIQNVVDISSKVMEAWVKYMGTAAKAAL